MPGIKSNNATFLERVYIVQEMLLSGFKRRDILQFVTNVEDESKKWNVCDSQIDKYIKQANENLLAEYESDTAKLKAKYSNRYDFIYKKAVNAKDYGLAASVNEKSTKLNIPPEPTKIEQSGRLSHTIDIDKESAKAIIDAINKGI